jgi:hypothetical protein
MSGRHQSDKSGIFGTRKKLGKIYSRKKIKITKWDAQNMSYLKMYSFKKMIRFTKRTVFCQHLHEAIFSSDQFRLCAPCHSVINQRPVR